MKRTKDIIQIFETTVPYEEAAEDNHRQLMGITFQVTDDCNLACSYCYQTNKGHHVMPFNIAKDFIDLLLENNNQTQQYIDTKKSQGVILDFIGGEPFLQINLIDNIIEYFIKRAIELDHPWQYQYFISLSSNGVLYFNPDVQKFLKKYNDALSLTISIDGNKQLHDSCRKFPNGEGSFDKILPAVQDYLKKHPYASDKVTFSPSNIQYLSEAIIYLIQLGYKNIPANCVSEKGWTLEHAKIYYYELKKLADFFIQNPDINEKISCSLFDKELFSPIDITDTRNSCGGNGKMLALDWQGNIFPCLRYMESSLGNEAPPFILGNTSQGFLYNDELKEKLIFLRSVDRINSSPKECISCPINKGCQSCTAYNYQINNGKSFLRGTYSCDMHKARALANVYYWNSIGIPFKNYLPDKDSLKIIPLEELTILKEKEQIGNGIFIE